MEFFYGNIYSVYLFFIVIQFFLLLFSIFFTHYAMYKVVDQIV